MSKKTFTREDLRNKIHYNLGFSKNFSTKLVNNLFEMLISAFEKNKNVKISSFGTFKVRNKKERMGRNPKTKLSAKISARKVVTFKASNLLKNKLKQIF